MATSLLMSKVIDIGEARRRRDRRERTVVTGQREKRRDYRRLSQDRLFVQIVACENQELIGTTIACAAVDTSAGGLRIETDAAIPDRAQLDLWVDNSQGPGKFFLSSDVRWVRSIDGAFQAGVELQSGAATDIAEWRELHGYI